MNHQALIDMYKNGSGFESRLADLYMVADRKNSELLINAFGDTFKKWEQLSENATEFVWNLQHSNKE
jgi:hypothetical protein